MPVLERAGEGGIELRNAPIAITGMHRSGTSMITRALHDSGLHLIGTGAEELLDAAEDNPEGFWENKAMVACNDELLEAAGGSWDNPPALPPLAVDDPRVVHIGDASTAAIAALSVHDHWGFKDPRTCLTAAYWLDLEPELRFIICVRHPLEVALSLKRRNQNSYSLGLALWERYYASVLEQVPADRRIVTHYDTFFVDPAGELARLCDFAGLEPAQPRVRSDLRHHTIGVDLGDAGASRSLRALYADLCRSAGVAPPSEAATDEGRVRRLILDGAVAERHADQRQAAIERLQEREQDFRAQLAEAEAGHRAALRDLEGRHRSTVRDLENRLAAERRDHASRLAELQKGTSNTLEAVQASLATIDQRTTAVASRLELVMDEVAAGPIRLALRRAERGAGRRLRRALRRGRAVARPAVRTAVHQLPPSAQDALGRGRRLVKRGVQQPGPTAKVTGRRVLASARTYARQLPPPAQQALRRGRSAYRRTTTAPVPTAKRAVRRLPPPAQRMARRGWLVAVRVRRSRHDASLAAEDAPPRPRPTPKGPAVRLWRPAFEQMVARSWSGTTPWLVVSPGSPPDVRGARAPKAVPFPDTADGQPFADDLSHIAHLEAQRYLGHRHLVVPEGSRPWFKQQAELRDHVVRRYLTVTDEPDAGMVFDLSGEPTTVASLRSAIDQVAGMASPAVLDWTGLDIATELHDLATFRPPDGERLPYLDSSVDVVVVERDRDHAEATPRGIVGGHRGVARQHWHTG